MNRICLYVFVVLYFLFALVACSKEKETKSDIPDLVWEDVFPWGQTTLALNDAVVFNIADTAYLGFGQTVLGGNECIYKYQSENHVAGWWHVLGPFSFLEEGERREAVSFVLDKKVYIGLGYYRKKTAVEFTQRYYDDFYVYDSEEKTWEPLLEFKFPGEARRGAVAFSLGGKGYVGTGLTEDGRCLSDFYEFDPEKGWTRIENMVTARWGANAFVADGNAYICFGCLNNDRVHGNWDVQKFNPETKSWEGQLVYFENDEEPSLMKMDGVVSFVLNKNGQDFVYCFGGDFNRDSLDDSYCWGFNSTTNEWKNIGLVQGREYAFSMNNRGYLLKPDLDGVSFIGKVFDFKE